MATRKDLLKAQSFTSRRMIAAFVDRDPDDPTPPLRRIGTATFVSVLIGVVLLAGTTLLGLLGGGTANDSWKQEQNVILSDAQSGALFVYQDEVLYPMADVASARLFAAGRNPSGQPRVIEVKTEALRGVEMGPEHGIPGAPRQLPEAKHLASYPVRLCSTAPQGANRYLTLEFGTDDPSSTSFAFVAQHSSGRQYLIYGGRTHSLYARNGQTSSIVPDLPVVTPGDSWINALPDGLPVVPKEVPGEGESGNMMEVGDVGMVVDGDSTRYYIQLLDGLSRISYLDMKAIQAKKGLDGDPGLLKTGEVPPATSATRPMFSDESMPMDEPKGPPGISGLNDVSVCATFRQDSPGRVSLSVDQKTPEIASNAAAPKEQYLDKITLPTLSGALLRNSDMVTDDGASTLLLNNRAYSIPTMGDRRALGYGDVTPLPVPPGLIALLEPGLTDPGNSLTYSMIVDGN